MMWPQKTLENVFYTGNTIAVCPIVYIVTNKEGRNKQN